MHRSPLNTHIPPLQQPFLPTVQYAYDLAFEADTVVDAYCAVHGMLHAWDEVYVSKDCSVTVYETGWFREERCIVVYVFFGV